MSLKAPKNGTNSNNNSGNNLTGTTSKPKVVSLTTNNLRASNTTAFHGQNHYENQDEGTLRVRIKMLEDDLARRQESYVRDERTYKARIEDLEEELAAQKASKTGWMNVDNKVQKLKSTHAKILDNIELVQDRTSRILHDQERDLLRAFRARLFDVQTELEKEKSKKDDGAGAWIERSRQLSSEVEWAKEIADRLEHVNQSLTQENTRLKTQFQSQEDDRNFLILQLVNVKKENEKLRLEYTAMNDENKNLNDQIKHLKQLNQATSQAHNSNIHAKSGSHHAPPPVVTMPMLPTAPMNNTAKVDSEERYKDVNVRLRKLLADERKSLSITRNNYAAELRARTEMELLLRTCVEEVRKEIAKKHLSTSYSNGIIPVENFTQEERERVLELLLSQERVVTLLYAKAFPVANSKNTHELVPGGNIVSMMPNMNTNTMNGLDSPYDALLNNSKSEGDYLLPNINKKSITNTMNQSQSHPVTPDKRYPGEDYGEGLNNNWE